MVMRIPFVAPAGGLLDSVGESTVTLHGNATISNCGLSVDGAGDYVTIPNFDYASDGSFTLGYWFTKETCNVGEWEYIFSHATVANYDPLDQDNPNINTMLRCDHASEGSFHRVIIVDTNRQFISFDFSLHTAGAGQFMTALSQQWVQLS